MAWDDTTAKKSKKARIVYSRFKTGDTKNGIKYSLGGLYVRRIVSYVSNMALGRIKKKSPRALAYDDSGALIGVYYHKIRPKLSGVRREHMIPISAAYLHLKKLFEEKKLSEDYIVKLCSKLHMSCITEEEDAQLNRKSRQCASSGWWKMSSVNRLKRYRDAGLEDKIWVKDFLNDDMSPRWKESGAKTNRTRQKKRISK